MPNIKYVSIEEDPNRFPRGADDLRLHPGRLVFLADLARLGIIASYDGAKKLPPPLPLPSEKKAWEARTILLAIGADLGLSDDAARSETERTAPVISAKAA